MRKTSGRRTSWRLAVGVMALVCAAGAGAEETNMASKADSVTWVLDNTKSIGGIVPTVQGKPKVIETEKGKALLFNGASQALFLAGTNPIAGAATFTLEALFRPDPEGLPEQRFVHIQAKGADNRVLLETRLDGASWYGDTYIRSGLTDAALADPKRVHPLGQWHTMAVVFDGTNMIQYVDGVKELSRAIQFQPMGEAEISIGCRINAVCWFKGAIRAVRFTKAALLPELLLKP